jgi:hypothetical protein
VRIAWYNAADAFISYSDSAIVAASTTFVRLFVSGVAPATAVKCKVYIQLITPAIGDILYADNLMLEQTCDTATYVRFEVSTDDTFAATDYDSGQVAITPIADGAEGIMVFTFIPLAAGTYYYRLCFWDDDNYTKTTWLVWNGTVVSNTPKVGYIRPSSDNSVAIETVFPAAPATHFDKVDELVHNDDTDYVETAVGTPKDQTDLYNLEDLSDVDFKDITSVAVNAYCKLTGGAGLSATLYLKLKTHATTYSTVALNIDVSGAYSLIGPWTHATNPFTTIAWTLDEITALIAGVRHYINDLSLHLRTTQLYINVDYNIYVFTFTPPGNNLLVIGFPSITSVEVTNDKDKYTFDVVISDTYIKPPIVTLTTGNDTEVMDYVNRTGTYVYTFSKTIQLERGDYEYHIEIGNVWTVIIDGIRFLHTFYNLNQDPKIEIFVGNQKIETWNHILTDNILPDLPEIEFDSDENIQSFDVTARFTKNDFKEYNMEIQGISKIPEGYHIRAREVANRDLEQVVTFASQAVDSLSLLKSLLPSYLFTGTLPEIIYLQAFLDEKIMDIVKRLLILNYAIGYVRNKKIYLYDLGNTNALFKMNVLDAQIGYDSDPSVIINKVREYYVRKMYPVPENIFTNYDAANWLGTVVNARQTINGVLPLSGSLYCLEGTGTISRIVDFLWSDFDQLNMNWCPDATTSLEIRLETDAGNYRTYTRTFSGQKGSGFVLTSSQPTDVVVKTLTFADKYINLITGIVTEQCSYKIVLKLDGVIVYTMDWDSTTGLFGRALANTLCDTIEISFTNLYPVGTTYGVDCSNLTIEEYVQVYEVTSITQRVVWHSRETGSAHLNWTYDAPSLTWSGTAHEEYGAVPPIVPLSGESYEIKINHCYIYASLGKPKVGGGIQWTNFHLGVGISVGIDERGILVADFSCEYSLADPTWVINLGAANYSFDVNRVFLDAIGEWVWKYTTYAWAEIYNLWDSLSIPFSLFANIGTPTNQVNTIRLLATGDNWYDTIYFVKNNPVPQWVEAENEESMAKGIKFQPRKTDGWSSKESALAFAKAFVKLFGEPAVNYSKQMSMQTDINIGDMVDCDGTILPVYKIVYDLNAGQMTIFVGRSVTDTLEWLKETSRKIEAIEKTIY